MILWRWVTLRHFLAEPGRTSLTLLGVALGVAVFVSIRLANASALASFTQTVDAVAGKANLAVVADSDGFDERVYPRVRATPGVEAAAPVVQTYVLARPGASSAGGVYHHGEQGAYTDTLLVLGIDVFAEGPFGRYQPQGMLDRLQAPAFLLYPPGFA